MIKDKNIDNTILKELDELTIKDKKELIRYIEALKVRNEEKIIKILNKTSGSWKKLVDAEKLKKNIYSDRLLSTRSKVNI